MIGNGRERRIAGDVSEQSFNAWRAFADGCGVSLVAMLEVLGPQLDRWRKRNAPPELAKLVQQAKTLDVERRRRRK